MGDIDYRETLEKHIKDHSHEPAYLANLAFDLGRVSGMAYASICDREYIKKLESYNGLRNKNGTL